MLDLLWWWLIGPNDPDEDDEGDKTKNPVGG